MNFNFGEVLSHAWQITWKHKVLWVFNILPVLIGFLFLPVMLIPFFSIDPNSLAHSDFFNQPGFIFLFVGISILNAIVSLVLYARGAASTSLGVLRLEQGEDVLSFKNLFGEGSRFFGRILGIILLVGLGVVLVVLVFSACFMVIGMLTMGLGMLCIQPLFLLMYPLMLILYAWIEQAQAAVVADDIGAMDAISRAWDLIKSNFWGVVLITLIIYLGMTILSSIVMLPFIVPFFFFPFLIENSQIAFNTQWLVWIVTVFSIILLPLIALIQGLSLTFMKSAMMLVYLRLTRNPRVQPVLKEAIA
jgi:hypothetical protein